MHSNTCWMDDAPELPPMKPPQQIPSYKEQLFSTPQAEAVKDIEFSYSVKVKDEPLSPSESLLSSKMSKSERNINMEVASPPSLTGGIHSPSNPFYYQSHHYPTGPPHTTQISQAQLMQDHLIQRDHLQQQEQITQMYGQDSFNLHDILSQQPIMQMKQEFPPQQRVQIKQEFPQKMQGHFALPIQNHPFMSPAQHSNMRIPIMNGMPMYTGVPGQRFHPDMFAAGPSLYSPHNAKNHVEQMKEVEQEIQAKIEEGKPMHMVHVIPVEPTYEPPKIVYDDNEPWVEVTSYEGAEPEPWAEFSTRRDTFTIDGLVFSDTSENPTRFCLGAATAHTNASKYVKMIGKGCKITRAGNGDVFLTNIGEQSVVFVQSYNNARRNGHNPEEVVYRIPSVNASPDETSRMIKIYDATEFPEAVSVCKSNRDLGKLTNECYARVAFLKGFGNNYPKRPTIKDCPIWIQIKVPAGLRLLDNKFQELAANDPNFFL